MAGPAGAIMGQGCYHGIRYAWQEPWLWEHKKTIQSGGPGRRLGIHINITFIPWRLTALIHVLNVHGETHHCLKSGFLSLCKFSS